MTPPRHPFCFKLPHILTCLSFFVIFTLVSSIECPLSQSKCPPEHIFEESSCFCSPDCSGLQCYGSGSKRIPSCGCECGPGLSGNICTCVQHNAIITALNPPDNIISLFVRNPDAVSTDPIMLKYMQDKLNEATIDFDKIKLKVIDKLKLQSKRLSPTYTEHILTLNVTWTDDCSHNIDIYIAHLEQWGRLYDYLFETEIDGMEILNVEAVRPYKSNSHSTLKELCNYFGTPIASTDCFYAYGINFSYVCSISSRLSMVLIFFTALFFA